MKKDNEETILASTCVIMNLITSSFNGEREGESMSEELWDSIRLSINQIILAIIEEKGLNK